MERWVARRRVRWRWGGRGEGRREGWRVEREERRGGVERAWWRVWELGGGGGVSLDGFFKGGCGEGGKGGRTICRGGFLVASFLMGWVGGGWLVFVGVGVGRRRIAAGLLEGCCCCCVRRRVFEAAVVGGEVVRLLRWVCRRVCMMGLGVWIERVLEAAEGRKRRRGCSGRGWLGLRRPWFEFNGILNVE